MIAQLSGTLVDKGLDVVVVDVGGVGYLVHISLATLQTLPAPGQAVRLLTHLQVREEALTLYGFTTAEERQVFELCLTVSGVGPKLALAAISGLGPAALGDAIASGDVGRLVRVPGVGKKTAERLVMELRDKFTALRGAGSRGSGPTPGKRGAASPANGPASFGIFGDVIGALRNLGYKPQDAERAVDHVLAAVPAGTPAPTIEEVLRRALRALQKE